MGHSRGPGLNFYHRRFAALRRPSGRAPGQAIAEFALVWPIFVVVVMALLEFGIAFNNLLTVNYPYQDQTAANTPGDRCVVLKGCTSLATNQGPSGHASLDTIGVRIIYRYSFVTPLSSAVSLLQGSGNFNGGQWTFTQQSVMRMEPIL